MGDGSAVIMFKRILSSGWAHDKSNRPVAKQKSSEGESLVTSEQGEEPEPKPHAAAERLKLGAPHCEGQCVLEAGEKRVKE